MLKGKLVYIFLFVSLLSFGQQRSKMLLASVQQASGTTATNYYTESNAMSSNEANSTTGLSAAGVTMVVETVDVQVGSYALKYTNTDGASDRVEEVLTLDNATDYTMTFYVKQESGANFDVATWVNASSVTLDITPTTTYQLATVTFTTTATSVTARFRNSGTGGTAVWIDDLKLFKTSEL